MQHAAASMSAEQNLWRAPPPCYSAARSLFILGLLYRYSRDMETYYVMIDEPETITMKSKFFTVVVGESERCQRKLNWLRQWCWEHNVFLAQRSHTTDVFMLNIAESLNTKLYLIPKLQIKISPLVAHIKNHNCTPMMPPDNPQAIFQRKQTDPKYYLFCNTSSRKRNTF